MKEQKAISISEWATTEMPLVQAQEVYSMQELADTLNSIFTSGLFLLRIEVSQTEFFRSWELLFGNEPAKLLYLESHTVRIDRKKLKMNLKKLEKTPRRSLK